MHGNWGALCCRSALHSTLGCDMQAEGGEEGPMLILLQELQQRAPDKLQRIWSIAEPKLHVLIKGDSWRVLVKMVELNLFPSNYNFRVRVSLTYLLFSAVIPFVSSRLLSSHNGGL